MKSHGRVQAATFIRELLRSPLFRVENKRNIILDLPYNSLIIKRLVSGEICSFTFDNKYSSDLISPFNVFTENGRALTRMMDVPILYYDMSDGGVSSAFPPKAPHANTYVAPPDRIITYRQNITDDNIIYPKNIIQGYESFEENKIKGPEDPTCRSLRMYTSVGDTAGTREYQTILEESQFSSNGPVSLPIRQSYESFGQSLREDTPMEVDEFGSIEGDLGTDILAGNMLMDGAMSFIDETVSRLGDASSQIVTGTAEGVGTVVKGAVNATQDVLSGAVSGTQDVLSGAIGGTRDLAQGVVAGTGQILGNTVGGLSGILR